MPNLSFGSRRLAPLAAALIAGLGVAVAVAVAGITTSTATNCATTTANPHTVDVDGLPVTTVGGDSLSVCATATATATDQTVTNTVTQTVTVTTGSTTPAPPAGGTPGIGVVLENGKLGIVTNPDQYATVIGGAWGGDVSTVVEKVPGLGLVYFNGSVVNTTYSDGVTYTDAVNNGWILQCGTSDCVNPTYNAYGADLGLAAYQNKWISNVKSYLAGHPGVDGIFIDTVLSDPKSTFGSYPNKYPDTASWSAATLSFVKAVYAALHPLGYYIVENASAYKAGDPTVNDGTATVNWWKQLGPYTDALMNEYFAENSGGAYVQQPRSTGTAWYQNWDGWQRLVGTAQAQGDDFFGDTTTPGMNTATAVYGKASFLLEWDGGGGSYSYGCGGSCDPTDPSWTQNIGVPKGAKFAVGVGWQRNYTAGTVLVNPSPSSSQTFTVNGTSYTLSPTTAKILVG